MTVIEQLLHAIAAEQEAAGEGVPVGANGSELAETHAALRRELGGALPPAYARMLAIRNGIDFNGLRLYGAEAAGEAADGSGGPLGLVAANRAWRATDDNASLLILGDSDMDFYAVDLASGTAGSFDRVSGDLVERHDSVAAMLEDVLRVRLGS